MLVTAAFTLLGALLPFAAAIAPPAATQPSPTGNINAVQTSALPFLPPKAPASPPAAGATTRRVHPFGRPDLCMTIQGGEATCGAELGIFYCYPDSEERAKWQLWDVTAAQSSSTGGQIKFSNASYCLSTGTDTDNAARPHLDKCVSTNDAKGKGQAWTVTRKGIANIKDGGNQCIDIRIQSPSYSGRYWESCRDVQTWTCADAGANNPNQQWQLMDSNGDYAGSTPEKRRVARAGDRR